jgi:hypothetical protein
MLHPFILFGHFTVSSAAGILSRVGGCVTYFFTHFYTLSAESAINVYVQQVQAHE